MLCQMTAILSGVSMLYLAVIVIIPSKKELQMGISIAPIMCSTIIMDNINLKTNPDGSPVKCQWASCREWCLSKDPALCYQIKVRPRLRGSNVTLEDCAPETFDESCSALNISNATPFRCKKGECQTLTGLYNCTKGALNDCRHISPAYDCVSKNISRQRIKCSEEACGQRLEGVVTCEQGECLELFDIPHYSKCTRKCANLKIKDKNTLIFSRERLIGRQCTKVTSSNGTGEMKSLSTKSSWVTGQQVLMIFCTFVTETESGYELDDCFNATLGRSAVIATKKDYRDFLAYHFEASKGREWLIDPEEALQVINDTKLLINSEGCTNTLQKECTQFFKDHTHDERDGRTRDRFPCFYTKSHNDFVTAQYNPDQTRMYLILASCVPAGLFFMSCGVLYLCSRLVNTDEEGHLALKSFKKDPIPRDASDL